MKGIILAGGAGTRLHPITKVVSKQLLPVYDKPMIYYPLSVLMHAGIRDIMIITSPEDKNSFIKLFGNGSKFGINIEYKEQPRPEGIAQAFILAEDFIGSDRVCLILGDNIFYGNGLNQLIKNALANINDATIFGYYVRDPQRYGVAEFDDKQNVVSIEEKPTNPKSNYAVVGLYFYPNSVVDIAKTIKPSSRGELEITDINKLYLQKKQLKMEVMGRGYAWLDTGTFESLLDASMYVQTIQKRQGLEIANLKEISKIKGWL